MNSWVMTELRKLKKELSRLKSVRKILPILLECSELYGDCFYNESDIKRIDKEIEEVTLKLSEIDMGNS